MMIPVDRENLRDALIAAAVGLTLAWLLSGCAGQPQPALTTAAAHPTQVATPGATGAELPCGMTVPA
jgi:Flp pilus assembly protein TadD